MERCLELALRGAGYVAPNPMVGAVLVYEDRIIGEGWHQQYGEAHAEVNSIESVKEKDKHLISQSTLYVSLEPCAHFGKTPPCTDLIIKNKIPKVIMGCRDPFKEVDGKGIEKLKAAGVDVEVGILENECKELNKRFFTFHIKLRPYVILKWAQTGDGMIAASPNPSQGGALESAKNKESFALSGSEVPPCGGFRGASRLLISNEYSNRLVHKWRSEEAAILVGTNTALQDDPELTTRLWLGNSPVRLVIDMNLRLPTFLKVFNGEVKTIIFNTVRQEEKENLLYFKLEKNKNLVPQLMNALYQLNIQSVLVEGGAKLLQSFIDEGIWDETRVVSSVELRPDSYRDSSGLAAPVLANAIKTSEQMIITDKIEIYEPKHS
ncbi:MAG: bifunctional diaminohydroxyphosphoribosylaminopyrimidine deaminase/5-amino-6-(5-phosphoribosylamino)uracil reductase RibD [Chitinophagaceae bacterium]|nr:bifunctional diaminohydroxyphosphoribosylaminopyrimidine deaminase/5-amino-6-(5-phosphoribosylamino)uracil reductase RibD [Chitinophagaceae bacterium]